MPCFSRPPAFGDCLVSSVCSEEMSWCGVTDEWVEERGRGKHYCNTAWAVEACSSYPHAPTYAQPSHANTLVQIPARRLFEGRFNHADTRLGATVVAAWQWPSPDAHRDEQSQHWHTSRLHVNSNQWSLSVKAPGSKRTDAAATMPLQSCRLSQINGQSWPHQYSYVPFICFWCGHMQWQIQRGWLWFMRAWRKKLHQHSN